jgi:uncharacterized protein
MTFDTVWGPLLGGALIGLGAVVLLLWNGRIAGITGIISGVLDRNPRAEVPWRVAFLLGLLIGGGLLHVLFPAAHVSTLARPLVVVAIAGLLVGFGARFGSGCTSGHGVCGIGRLSPRSIVATVTFMLAGMVMVAVFTRLLGGGA